MSRLGEESLQPLKLGHGSVYILPSSEGAVLMELGVGTAENWDKLTEAVRSRGYGVSDVRAALLTHAHFDHIGQLRRLRAESKAEILIHAEDAWALTERYCHMGWTQRHVRRQMLENGAPLDLVQHRWSDEQIARWDPPWYGFYAPSTRPGSSGLFPAGATGANWPIWDAAFADGMARASDYVPTHPDRTFEDGEELVFGDLRLVAYHTPGHTWGHAVFYEPEGRTLFSGDHLLKGITPNPVIEFRHDVFEARTRGLPAYLRSLDHIRHLHVDRVLPAHGEPMMEFEEAIVAQEGHIRKRGERILSMVKAGTRTAWDIVSHLYPHIDGVNAWTAMNRVIGQLDILEDEGKAAVQHDNGLFLYRAL